METDNSEIIYNPSNVSQGKQVLADASNNLGCISSTIESGKSSIMGSGFKGNVDIDTAQLKTEANTLETTIDNITHVERAIQEYSSGTKEYIINGNKRLESWYQAEYNGTYYSSAALGAAQITRQYNKEKEEFRELTEKIMNGTATDREIERASKLAEKLPETQKKVYYLDQEAQKNSGSLTYGEAKKAEKEIMQELPKSEEQLRMEEQQRIEQQRENQRRIEDQKRVEREVMAPQQRTNQQQSTSQQQGTTSKNIVDPQQEIQQRIEQQREGQHRMEEQQQIKQQREEQHRMEEQQQIKQQRIEDQKRISEVQEAAERVLHDAFLNYES